MSNYYTKLIESLKQEAVAAHLCAESHVRSSEWRLAMDILGKKMNAAANAIEVLVAELEEARNHGNS